MQLLGIRAMAPGNTPVALLVEQGGRRALPIPVGAREGAVLAAVSQGAPAPGWVSIIDSLTTLLDTTIRHVAVSSDDDATMTATIMLSSDTAVPCHPAEALMVSVTHHVPFLCSEHVLAMHSIDLTEDMSDDDQVDQLRTLLQAAHADDFRPNRHDEG